MKATGRTAALSRHHAPAFVLVGGLELQQLRKLPWIARALYVELLAMADHATGRISTSYAVLGALLSFDRDPCAHAQDQATVKRLRTAIDALVSLGLVRVDRIKNEKAKGLFFRVRSRAGITAPDERKGRLRGRPAEGEKPASMRPSGRRAPDEGQTEGQGVQEGIHSPLPPVVHRPPAAVAAELRKVAESLRKGGINRAPKGA